MGLDTNVEERFEEG